MSDFLERNGLQTVAQHFKDLFLASVHRDGAEELLERLENETDFFEAPAEAKHHGCFPVALVIHTAPSPCRCSAPSNRRRWLP